MRNRTFSIPVNHPVNTRNGLYKVTHLGDEVVSYNPETMSIDSIMFGGVNILPVVMRNDPTLDFYYSALEAHEEYLRTERGIEQENNYEGAYN